MLSSHRKGRSGGNGISYRYDWRPLLAVIRAYLPQKELLVGETLKGLDSFYGNEFAQDLPYFVGKSQIPFNSVAPVGTSTSISTNPSSSQMSGDDSHHDDNASGALMTGPHLCALLGVTVASALALIS